MAKIIKRMGIYNPLKVYTRLWSHADPDLPPDSYDFKGAQIIAIEGSGARLTKDFEGESPYILKDNVNNAFLQFLSENITKIYFNDGTEIVWEYTGGGFEGYAGNIYKWRTGSSNQNIVHLIGPEIDVDTDTTLEYQYSKKMIVETFN